MKNLKLVFAILVRVGLFSFPIVIVNACSSPSPELTRATPTRPPRIVFVVATNPPATPSAASTHSPSATLTVTVAPTATPPPSSTPTSNAAQIAPSSTHLPTPSSMPSLTTAPLPSATAPPLVPTAQPTPTQAPTLAPTEAGVPITAPPPNSFVPTELVLVAEGILRMGSNIPGDDPDEKPEHDAPMYEYWIEKFEVTNAQYAACVSAGACPPPVSVSTLTRPAYFGNSEFANFPVVNVTWFGADAYCKWVGRRLPNEGEWERASRGIDNWRYPFSNSIGMHFEWNAIYNGSPISFCEASCPLQNFWQDVNDGFPETAPVGWFSRFDSSKGFGVVDTAGNVSEWVSNWYAPDAYAAGIDVHGPGEPTGLKVYRGGSWADEPRRSSDRNALPPDQASDRIGFRCAQ